jgi:hypothetical protein
VVLLLLQKLRVPVHLPSGVATSVWQRRQQAFGWWQQVFGWWQGNRRLARGNKRLVGGNKAAL